MKMCDKELLIAYVYEDISDMDRVRFERHLRECAACRGEIAAIRTVRQDLATWDPPQPNLDFRVTQGSRPSWRAWWTPALGLAAAAVLVLAAAAAVANVEVSYGQNGFAVRTGWNRAAGPVANASVGVAADTRAASIDRTTVADFDRRLHQLEVASHGSPVRQVSVVPGARLSDTEMLRRVRDLLAQSESRQQQELALRIGQVIRDVEAQRVADLTRIQQGLGRIDAMTTQEAAAHRDLANYILTSSKNQK
jgi:anti-sigma factor RsiW